MSDRMGRFTQNARRVLSYAQEEAEKLRADQIGTEHLLIGLLRENSGLAYNVLLNLNFSVERLNLILLQSRLTRRDSNQRLDLSPGFKIALYQAMQEAEQLKQHYISTEHLLLGLVKEPDDTMLSVLQRFNITAESMRGFTLAVMRIPSTANPPDRRSVLIQAPSSTRKIIEQAKVEAQKWGTTTVQPIHVMLALLDQEDESISAALKHFNITPDDLRRQIADTLQKRLPPDTDESKE